jgi:Domain of unknown function (DUF4384)
MTSRFAAIATGLAMMGLGQQSGDDQPRQIIAEEFLKSRPAPVKSTDAKRPIYKPSGTSANRVKPVSGTVDLGVTLWRLRASTSPDDGARLLVQDASAGQLAAERIDTGATLALGDRVRLTIESPTSGFLYVIDREIYKDGTTSDPYLIFPTTRTRQGDNAVRGGRLIDIPDQQDRPNYFTVRPSSPGQVGELLTIVVSPTALDRVTISDKPLMLARDLVASWEKAWSAPVQQFAQEGGSKRVWTREEQAAAADGTRLLTQDDPAPQTIFRVAVKKAAPLMVDVRLPYATSNR